jgi:phospholipase/lecithinase/hemolysin
MLTRKAKLLLSLTAATPLLFAACVDNSLVGPYGDVAGTYQLTVFQGRSIPVTYTYAPGETQALPNGGTIRWTDGTMLLRSDGTFRETNNYIITPSGQSSSSNAYVSSGTFSVSGTQLTLSAPAQNNEASRFATGTIDLDRINYTEDDGLGNLLAYEYIL